MRDCFFGNNLIRKILEYFFEVGLFKKNPVVLAGSTLIEVLISLAILGLGVGGVIATQTISLKNNQSALFRTHASILLVDMSERLRNNARLAQEGAYSIDWCNEYSGARDCGKNQCNTDQIRQYDLNQWLYEINQSLPGGEGRVSAKGDNVTLIEIRWQDKGSKVSGNDTCAEGDGMYCMAMQVQI